MPLRDVERWHAWIERDHPSAKARLVVAEFLVVAAGAPWAAPSVPVPELSDQPVSELRVADLHVPGEGIVSVFYRRWFTTEDIDVIDVVRGPDSDA